MAPRIAYVSDLDLRVGGGGSYVVNWNAFEQLKLRFECKYVGPVVPHASRAEVLVSRLRRKLLRRPGKFAYFSPSTLASNAARVESLMPRDVDAVMFRSAARWCRVRPAVPYFVYLDAVFHTFFQNTFDPDDFERTDIERIFEAEAAFLENAAGVFFESRWALAKAKEAYSLRGAKYFAVGRGGALEPPEQDSWDGRSREIVTVAMNFAQKGGDLVFEAFRSLKPEFPKLSWRVIGGRPPDAVINVEGISYEGVLDPGIAAQRARFADILSNAFLLVHPTREDTSPLVITEAAYFGCPAISVNQFAIAELVVNGVTGILLESARGDSVAPAVRELLLNSQRYGDMRRNARAHSVANFSWQSVGNMISERIADVINPHRSQ
jgi:glycosyltransferase involved in cell wall biosynthesis